jgi:1,4-alpha-glucan branching enzyme
MKAQKLSIFLLTVMIIVSAANCSEHITPYTPDGTDTTAVNPSVVDTAKLSEGITFVPSNPDADSTCTIWFKAASGSALYGYSGDVYAHLGIVDGNTWLFVPAGWDTNLDKCKMTFVGTNIWNIALSPSIRSWFGSGTTPISKIGVVIRSSDGTMKGVEEDTFCYVTDETYSFTPGEVTHETMPSGMEYGINTVQGSSEATLVLYDKDRDGGCKDYCYLIGDFNGWKIEDNYMLKRDDDAGCWWITLTGLDPDKLYAFQYYIGTVEDGGTRIADPYSELVLNGDDSYISSNTYPDMPDYPDGGSGYVSTFKINNDEYDWNYPDFKISDPDNLVIYELHLRDFTETGDLNGAEGKLYYLKNLGINAIELMPVQEFEGNDSWGYNPCFYFSLDKAYGTRNMYKKFIDECHSLGIAVIFDVVYNQATGSCPLAALYWDASGSKPSALNPWFNTDAPHPYSVFCDFDHESALTRAFVKRSIKFLLNEYNIDGFRFDLTKGFTDKQSDESTASDYDASRIAILKDYHSAVTEANPDAVMICEHFCCLSEENALANDGMKLWNNLNDAYCQSAMGYSDDSGFGSLWTGTARPFGSQVGYMESHDEERTSYKQVAYGISSIKSSLSTRMKQEKCNAAFFFTVPGPKMIWQFEELGYDISIEENGRTGRKPLHWEYYNDPLRKDLYDTYAKLLQFRSENPEFFGSEALFSWKVSASDWSAGRFISCTSAGGDKAFEVAGNFDDSSHDFSVTFPIQGEYTEYFTDSTLDVNAGTVDMTIPAHEFRLYVKK